MISMWMTACLGENTEELAQEKADQIELVLNWGGFSLKGVTFSKRNPSSNFSADDCSDKWFPKEDISTISRNFLGVPVGSRGKSPENFGYFAFWIAQKISLVVICLFLD